MRAPRHPAALVAGLGASQLVAWGTLYYAIAVLGAPIGAELGLSSGHVFGAFAWSMVICGVLAPWAGRTLDRVGGRALLIASALLGAMTFATLGRVHSFGALIAAWSLGGLAMALGLYDTCFAAIGHAAPGSYRRTVTGVTLVAGFASTVSWPATHYLVQWLGWRASCNVHAIALLSCAMLLLALVSVLPFIVFLFAFVYGVSNGLLTIAKATLPVEMFGLANVGAVLGSFSAPSLITRAVAPFGFAVAMGALGDKGAVFGLVVVSLASCAAYVATTNARHERSPTPHEA